MVKMKIICISLFLILLSLSEKEAAGYSTEINPHVSVKTDGNNEDKRAQPLQSYVWIFGRPDNKSSHKETVPLTTPADGSIEKDLNVDKCPNSFTKLGDQCYYFSPEEETGADALNVCKVLGSTLAYPVNSKENSLLKDHISKNYETANWYIGASDAGEEGTWVWIHDQSPINYTDWLAGEPNNGFKLGSEECVVFGGRYSETFQWVDFPCSWSDRFICQR